MRATANSVNIAKIPTTNTYLEFLLYRYSREFQATARAANAIFIQAIIAIY